MNTWNRCAGLAALAACVSACSDDGLPAAPAKCQEPLAALTPWWSSSLAADPTDPCATGWNLGSAPIQAQGGVVYYAAQDSVCAVDASGIRPIASTIFGDRVGSGPVGGFWLDGDRVIYTDGFGVYAVPIAGGDPSVLFPLDDLPGVYDYDGTFFYWSASDGIFRRSLAADGTIENLLPDSNASRIRVSGDRIDLEGGQRVDRLPLNGDAATTFDLGTSGELLASTGDFTYVRYQPHPDAVPVYSPGFDEALFDLGVIDSGGILARAWTGNVPRILPTTGSVFGGTLYAGGRLHYHDGAAFVGVVAIAAGASSGTVVGCSPTQLVPNREWAVVLSTAADELGVYALVDRTDVQPTEYALVRFPLP
jgi:hypothetical protein